MKKITLVLICAVVAALLFTVWQMKKSDQAAPYRIGVVSFTAVDRVTYAGFQEGLKKLGYGNGRKPVEYLFQSAGGDHKVLAAVVEKVLAFQPDLIFVSSTPATQAVKKATRQNRIPVVFGPVNDPLSAGIVPKIRQPGGNITGIRLSFSGVRRLQLFQQLSPDSKRYYLPYHPDDKSALASLEQILPEAKKLGITVLPRKLSSGEDLADALLHLPENADAIYLPRDSRVEVKIDDWVKLSLKHKVPLCAPSRQQMERGALFSYGFSHSRIGEQAAGLAAQIIEGADPGTLPVETAESYSFLNMKTAADIGLELSDNTLRQINEIFR